MNGKLPGEHLRSIESPAGRKWFRARALTIVPQALVILLVALVETRVIWAPTLLWGHSAWLDLTRMVEFDGAIRAGNYLPVWSPDLYHGYGSPLFQFYSPLVYYLAEIPRLAGADFATAFKLTQVFMLVASGAAMYRLATEHVSRWPACFGAVLYMVAPYRIVDLFVRHALAEHAAFVWFPLLVWGTERFAARRMRAGLFVAVAATAGLILTHNVMALIGLPVCVIAGWFLSGRANDWKRSIAAGIPAAFGVGVAAVFWWPALRGRIYTQAEESLTVGYFDYHRHFADAWQFLSVRWGFGQTGGATAETMPLQIGVPHLLVGMLALIFICMKGRTRWSIAGVVMMSGSLLMCHGWSEPIWALPLLKYVQFPWRFMGLAVFGAAMCGAGLLEQLRAVRPRLELPVCVFVLLAVMGAYFPYYNQARFLAADSRANSLTQVTGDRVAKMRAEVVLLPLESVVTRETIREVGERATSGDDFLPRGVTEKPGTVAAEPLATEQGKIVEWNRADLNCYRATVSLRESGTVELHQFWFPGWQVWLDGRSVPALAAGKSAVVSCAVPAGKHALEFNYTGLPDRHAGFIASIVSLVLASTVWFITGRVRTQAERVSP